jgi:mannobiose 2-epimerase
MNMIQRFTTLLLVAVLFQACQTGSGKQGGKEPDAATLAGILEESLFTEVLDLWYPRNIDSVNGGYVSSYNRDWSLSEGRQAKALVQQARHVWATSFIYEHYPERKEFLAYADHGFRFLADKMWDPQYGGFYTMVAADGTPARGRDGGKRIYGQAFAVYGLSQYYRVSANEEALDLAEKAFMWMDDHAHDPGYGGYFEILGEDGTPVEGGNGPGRGSGDSMMGGLKDYNSSIHLMEAFTELYRVWPDSLVRNRLEEMFFLVRDTFTHPDGYLQLYFFPDWTLVSDDDFARRSGGSASFTNHITYGHDVETAYLLLETAHVLGWGEDEETHRIAKKLVDHSIASGWDTVNGGFFDAGKFTEDGIVIIERHKSWWGQAEGLNALLLMHTLYPDDPEDYYGKFLKMWEHIDHFLIDKEYGGWFNSSTDTYPENVDQAKSHIWKTTYHNSRAMVHCIEMLRSLSGDPPVQP